MAEEILARASDKLLMIVESAARHARARMLDELSSEELTALFAGGPPKLPKPGTLEHHLAAALFEDGKRKCSGG
jgi:hypothetical protein